MALNEESAVCAQITAVAVSLSQSLVEDVVYTLSQLKARPHYKLVLKPSWLKLVPASTLKPVQQLKCYLKQLEAYPSGGLLEPVPCKTSFSVDARNPLRSRVEPVHCVVWKGLKNAAFEVERGAAASY